MQYIAPTTCVLPYFCRSSGGGSKVKPEIAPIEARSVADRGSLQLYVFYHTSVASSRGQCNTSLQLRVFYRTSVALVGVDLRSNQKSARSGENRGSLQLYVFYHTFVASSRGQCNTSLQLRVFYRTSVALAQLLFGSCRHCFCVSWDCRQSWDPLFIMRSCPSDLVPATIQHINITNISTQDINVSTYQHIKIST